MMKKIIAVLAVAAFVGCTACGAVAESSSKKEKKAAVSAAESSETAKEETSVVSEESSAQETVTVEDPAPEEESSVTGQDPGGNYEDTDSIGTGVWLSVAANDMGEDEYYRNDTYYEFREDGTGYALDQYSGKGVGFEYTLNGSTLTLVLDLSDEYQDAKETLDINVNFVNKDNMEFSTDTGYKEDLTYLTDEPIAYLEVYPTSELEDMSQEYFNASDGRGCGIALGSIDRDDLIKITLYEDSDKFEVVDTYKIDRYTAKGTDSKGNQIDLLDPPKI